MQMHPGMQHVGDPRMQGMEGMGSVPHGPLDPRALEMQGMPQGPQGPMSPHMQGQGPPGGPPQGPFPNEQPSGSSPPRGELLALDLCCMPH